jgi:hypothetical protein
MIRSAIAYKFSFNYCPIISRLKDHQPLMYDLHDIEASQRLKIERVNFTQVDHQNVIQLLQTQIKGDKMIFHKEKEVSFIMR